MRKWIFLLWSAVLLLAVMPAAAQSGTPSDMARYYPAKAGLFIAFRTDPAFLDEIDGQLAKLHLSQITPTGQPTSVRAVLETALAEGNTNLSELFAWLGDYASIGFIPLPDQPADRMNDNWIFVAQVRDRAAAEAYLDKIAPDTVVKETVGAFTKFSTPGGDGVFFINDEALFLFPANADTAQPPALPEASLIGAADFQTVLGSLPADSYNALLYILPKIIPQTDPQAALLFQNAGPLLVGLTVQGDSVLTIDTAQLRGRGGDPAPAPAVDLAFAQYIPSSATAVIQGKDLNNLYNNNLLNLLSISQPDSNVGDQLSLGLRAVGLDLQKDVLDWMTGNFALFLRTDTLPILDGIFKQQVNLTGNLDFGLVVEATDPAAAQSLATKFSLLLKQATASGNSEGVSLSDDTIGGTPVTVIHLDPPASSGMILSLEIVLGANENIFFVATRSAAQAILTGDGILSHDPTYAAAQSYFLPNTATVWYTNGEGAVGTVGGLGTIFGGVMLGPAIGSVFDEIVAGLETSGPTAATATPPPTLTPAEQVFGAGMTADRVRGYINGLIASVNHASITSAVTEGGVSQLRLVLQLQGE